MDLKAWEVSAAGAWSGMLFLRHIGNGKKLFLNVDFSSAIHVYITCLNTFCEEEVRILF